MANVVESILSEDLIEALRKEHLVTIATIDFETNSPNVHAISWVYAMGEKSIRFAVEQRSRILDNIIRHSGVALTIIVNESVYSIYGYATVLKNRLENVPLKVSLIELHVNTVRDVMFYGSKIAQEPTYEKAYDIHAAKKLDNQVLKAMQEV